MASHLRRTTCALMSVSDKTGLVDFARALAGRRRARLHRRHRQGAGGCRLAVNDVAELTGFPEMMDGRVKTLHPSVHGGLLASAPTRAHAAAMAEHGIAPIDLLVVNLYPFEATVAKARPFDDCIENIDIGGPAMIRAAAKNHAYVAVVRRSRRLRRRCWPRWPQHGGTTTLELRRRLAAKAFARTAAYDAAISGWFADAAATRPRPTARAFGGKLDQTLRYGENPHQSAAFYRAPASRARRRHRAAAAGQGAVLQQHQRHRRGLRTGRRVRSAPPRLRDHQARQSLRRGDRRQPRRRPIGKALACDPVSRLRRHRRGQPPARRRGGARRSPKIFTEVVIAPDADDEAIEIVAREEESARCCWPAACPIRAARGLTVELGGRRLPGADARQRRVSPRCS